MLLTICQIFINGLLIGGVYSLVSIGLTLIFGVMKIINFAHGEFLMIAMYFTFWIGQFLGVNPYLSMIIVVPLFFIIGFGTQRFIIQPVINTTVFAQIFVTIGLSFALQSFALMIWKGDYRTIEMSYIGSNELIKIWGLRIPFEKLGAFFIAMGMSSALFIFLKRTKIGKAIRASAQDLRGAQLSGINVYNIYRVAFGMGSACVGVAGAILMPIYQVFPTVGVHFVLMAYIIVVIGGMGNMAGAFLGGLLIGLIEVISGYFLAPALKETVCFIIFILVLLVRPQGLLGEKLR
jgi:branched-chain amino acid transport system permease protein